MRVLTLSTSPIQPPGPFVAAVMSSCQIYQHSPSSAAFSMALSPASQIIPQLQLQLFVHISGWRCWNESVADISPAARWTLPPPLECFQVRAKRTKQREWRMSANTAGEPRSESTHAGCWRCFSSRSGSNKVGCVWFGSLRSLWNLSLELLSRRKQAACWVWFVCSVHAQLTDLWAVWW